jgi:uncharacterized protein YjbI with pentapeptide repeats
MKWFNWRPQLSNIPPWTSREGFHFAAATVLMLGQAIGQANDLRLAVTPGSPLELTWRTVSATLANSPPILPDTQLEVSSDLKKWQPLGQVQQGGLNTEPATVTRSVPPSNGIRYFRVRAKVSLPKADLAKANLVGSDLRGANLAQTNLTQADLANANLDGADLTGAILTGANLAEATLGNVNLTNANLTGATIGPWFNFPESVYHNTTMPDGSVRTHDESLTLLIQLYVDGAPKEKLSGRDFSGWDLRGVELQGRNLTGSNFTGSDLRNVKLDQAQLSNADLTKANLQGVTGFNPTDHSGIIINQTILPDGTLND